MHGLPQSGILANILLAKRLTNHGYGPIPRTHRLWTHKWRPIKFSLVVDDFGIMYVGREHAEHLKTALEENYEISTDCTGGLYCGIKLQWDYETRTVDLSMPSYIAVVGTSIPTSQARTPTICTIQASTNKLRRQGSIFRTS
jgi:hypothetical protein